MKYIFFILSLGIYSQQENIIHITQTNCQFVEMEGSNLSFTSQNEKDCAKINSETLQSRKKNFKPLKLKAGLYKFIIKNESVPYEVGFWLRGKGISRFYLPSVSGGDLYKNKSKEYSIDLKKGSYYASCPLNSTPDYEIIVE
jgi:hypothetical protein